MGNEFVDRELQCKDCPTKFIFSAGEQEFFAQKQLQDPVRCKPCRAAKRAQKDAQGGSGNGGGGNGGGNGGGSRPVVTEVHTRRGGGGGGGGRGRRRSYDDDRNY